MRNIIFFTFLHSWAFLDLAYILPELKEPNCPYSNRKKVKLTMTKIHVWDGGPDTFVCEDRGGQE